jgi:hypothetical protein
MPMRTCSCGEFRPTPLGGDDLLHGGAGGASEREHQPVPRALHQLPAVRGGGGAQIAEMALPQVLVRGLPEARRQLRRTDDVGEENCERLGAHQQVFPPSRGYAGSLRPVKESGEFSPPLPGRGLQPIAWNSSRRTSAQKVASRFASSGSSHRVKRIKCGFADYSITRSLGHPARAKAPLHASAVSEQNGVD